MQNIKLIRKSKKIKQSDLAKSSGISRAYLSELENGKKTNPSTDVLMRIANALDVSIAELMNG